jgi:hypothetical protein
MVIFTKKIIYAIAILFAAYGAIDAQTLDTVSMGAGYTNQVWYQFANDREWKNPKNNYDLAFSVRQFEAAVWVNTPAGTSLFRSSRAAAAWSTTTDTIGSSPEAFNSDTSWIFGAFNRTGNGVFDYGWGSYNPNTHDVTGDSVYILRLPSGVFKKFLITKLAYDSSYYFKYANLDGTDERNIEIKKKTYDGRNFVYYSIQNNAIVDREPTNNKEWDITFLQYTGLAQAPNGTFQNYTLTGILHNDGVKVARVIRDTSNNAYVRANFKSDINQIGANWKLFNMTTNTWQLSDTTTYFVQTRNKRVYKMIFTKFGGSSTGDFIFTRQYMLGTDVKEVLNGTLQFTTYPNPATDGAVKVLYNFANIAPQKADLRLFDLSGRTLHTASLDASTGLHEYNLPNLGLTSGLYLVAIIADGKQTIQKIVIQ